MAKNFLKKIEKWWLTKVFWHDMIGADRRKEGLRWGP
jgi:hypothetical protein